MTWGKGSALAVKNSPENVGVTAAGAGISRQARIKAASLQLLNSVKMAYIFMKPATFFVGFFQFVC
jgi:uncharacterized protein YbjT (DUF2867 family)